MGSIQRTTSVAQAPVSALLAQHNGVVRMADFDSDGRFRCWSGEVARAACDIANNDHALDLVKITRCRDSSEASPLDEARIEMHVSIQLPPKPVYAEETMFHVWSDIRSAREWVAAAERPYIPTANEIRAQLGLPGLPL